MLKIRCLQSGYDNLKVLKSISLHIETGEIVTLIGANGAGKSTLVKTITGLVKPSSGKIVFDKKDISRRRFYKSCNCLNKCRFPSTISANESDTC